MKKHSKYFNEADIGHRIQPQQPEHLPGRPPVMEATMSKAKSVMVPW